MQNEFAEEEIREGKARGRQQSMFQPFTEKDHNRGMFDTPNLGQQTTERPPTICVTVYDRPSTICVAAEDQSRAAAAARESPQADECREKIQKKISTDDGDSGSSRMQIQQQDWVREG